MRERIRLLLAVCFYYSGLVRLAYWWSQRKGRRLIILNYHRAQGKNLRRQMSYLRRHYRVLHLDEALQELYAPCQQQRISSRGIPLVLTFDDGYLDNYTYGWQLARTLQVPITIFLVPGYSESGQCFWWLAGDYLVQHTKIEEVTIEGRTYCLERATERQALVQAIDARARSARSVAEREEFLAVAQQALGVALPCRASAGSTDLPLNWHEIREMEQSGWVSFGAHTMHHPVLSCLVDAAEVQQEVSESRHVLEQQLGHPIQSFAYPIGKYEHIGAVGLQAVKEAGYRWGLSTIEEVNTTETDPYLIRRLPGDENLHWLVMAAELVGLLGIVSRLRRKR